VLGLGGDAILYGPDMLGRLLDTFVAAHLRAELAAGSNDPRLYHLRKEQGRREVELLIETASGQLIGIEVKAAATVTASDAHHLAWLRDQTGDAFAAGIVLHTSPYAFPVSDRIVAVPVSTLWSELVPHQITFALPPVTCAPLPASHQPVRYHHPVPEAPGRPARWHIEPAIAGREDVGSASGPACGVLR
jgi:hypothetical protein